MSDVYEVEQAILSSTRASWNGSYYVLEVVEDHYRVVWADRVGNLYYSPGIMLPIPALSENEYDEYDEDNSYFDDAIEQLERDFNIEVNSFN